MSVFCIIIGAVCIIVCAFRIMMGTFFVTIDAFRIIMGRVSLNYK